MTLRQQALVYRRRAWGINFCRDHLNQLLSEHNTLWEPTETTDSATDPPTPRSTSEPCHDLDHNTDTPLVEALDLCRWATSGRDNVRFTNPSDWLCVLFPAAPVTPAGDLLFWNQEKQTKPRKEMQLLKHTWPKRKKKIQTSKCFVLMLNFKHWLHRMWFIMWVDPDLYILCLKFCLH